MAASSPPPPAGVAAPHRVPPGYAVPGRSVPPGQDAAAPAMFRLGLWWVAALGAGFELLVHQPRLLGDAALGAGGLPTRALAALGLLLGVAAGWRRGPAAVPGWLAAAGALWAGLGALGFAVVGGRAPGPLAPAWSLLCAGSTALALTASGRVLLPLALRLGWIERWVAPFHALLVVAVLALGATGTAFLGPWRAAAFVGAVLVWLAWGWSGVEAAAELPGARARPGRARRGLLALGPGAVGASLVVAELLTPLGVTARHAGETLWMERARHETWVLTSNHGAVELFENHRLRASSLVDHRLHEGLAQPALRLARQRRRVLVLGGGLGLLEREVLRHPDVERLTVVAPDAALAAFARRLPWLAERARHALDDPRVELVIGEPLPWLDATDRRWDVILLDLPDPSDPRAATPYTVAAAERYARALAPEGVLATQAVTPFATPLTSAGVRAALEAVGLVTAMVRVPVPTLGEWGFVLAARGPLLAHHDWPPGLRYLGDAAWAEAWRAPADAAPARPPEPSRLHHLRVVDDYAAEVARLR